MLISKPARRSSDGERRVNTGGDMRSKKMRLGILGAIVSMMLLAQPLSPANGAAAGFAIFLAKCRVSSDTGLPIVGPNKGTNRWLSCWAGNKQTVNNSPTALIAYQWDVPVKDYKTKGPDQKDRGGDPIICVSGGPCNGGLSALGIDGPTLISGPWCGHSGGVLTLSFNGNNATVEMTYFTLGTSVLFTGTYRHNFQTGPFLGIGDTISDVQKPNNSCVPPGTARDFRFAGIGVGYKTGPLFNSFDPFGK
jgi:hypothetical protein